MKNKRELLYNSVNKTFSSKKSNDQIPKRDAVEPNETTLNRTKDHHRRHIKSIIEQTRLEPDGASQQGENEFEWDEKSVKETFAR